LQSISIDTTFVLASVFFFSLPFSTSLMPDATITTIPQAVAGMTVRGLLKPAETIDDHCHHGFFYDLDGYRTNLASLRSAFPSHWHHATAVKTNPVTKVREGGAAGVARVTERSDS